MRRLPCSLLALLLLSLTAPARADIPLPKPDRASDGLAEWIELGEIEPLPPVSEVDSRAGAGRLPNGVIVETEVTELAPVLRQVFLVTQTILDPARQLRDAEVHRPQGQGMDARPLGVTRETVDMDGRLVDRRHYRWAVQALRGGDLTLAFSRIDFQVVGLAQSEYAFVPVARRLEVVDLPAHLPSYLPVTPDLAVGNAQVGELVAGEPASWRFEVSGEGLTAAALAQMINAQLVAPSGLRLGQPEVRLVVDGSAGPAEISPLAETWQVSLSLLPSTEGGREGRREAELPGLRLPYVDPRRPEPGSQLDYAQLDAQAVSWQAAASVRRLQWLQRALPWLATGLLGAIGVGLAGRAAWRRLRARRNRRAAQARLRSVDDALALRRQLLAELAGLPRPLRPDGREVLAGRGAPETWLAAVGTLESWCFAGAAVPATGEFVVIRETIADELPAGWFR